jgi:hypothetical protein
LHYLRAESTVQQAVGRRAATTRDADDRASGDSLILESGGQLESCPTLIENTERYWTICR